MIRRITDYLNVQDGGSWEPVEKYVALLDFSASHNVLIFAKNDTYINEYM